MMEEVWKEIVGYEGHYEVSNLGRVRVLPRIVLCGTGVRVARGRMLTQRRIKTEKYRRKAYYRIAVELKGEGSKSKTHFVNKLVATAFIPNPKRKPLVMYKDFDFRNNSVSNLQWATRSEVAQYASKNGRYTISGSDHASSKKVRQFYKTGKYKRTFYCISEASEITGIGRTSIQDALSGRSKTSGGFIWKY